MSVSTKTEATQWLRIWFCLTLESQHLSTLIKYSKAAVHSNVLQSPPVFGRRNCCSACIMPGSNLWTLFIGEMLFFLLFFMGFFLAFFLPTWGKDGKMNIEPILFSPFLLLFPNQQMVDTLLFFFLMSRKEVPVFFQYKINWSFKIQVSEFFIKDNKFMSFCIIPTMR